VPPVPAPDEPAPAHVLAALAATVSYRLEPAGWGSRFPVVLDHLLAGRLTPSQVAAAAGELAEIANELAKLPADRVVWSLADLGHRDDTGQPVDRAAACARDYFLATDGRPLLAVLQERVVAAGRDQAALSLPTGGRRRMRIGALALAVAGVAWAALGYLYARNWIIVPEHAVDVHHGPLLWPFGALVMAVGLLRLLTLERPAAAAWARRHGGVTTAIGVALLGGFLALVWR
jgi:hypothetical protein